ncbi:MAG: polyribonucleotide nucleotidyltransferase [Candidatus Abawacabacteria bacterium RBG_16_42_10]|uniref:Polyribonucleotide nucleotidyltransferase n=1 Tax=Candidatus Abawacabacteria bacterium RBG_16_42_10 TaxID=1817814 RepID=A0A1F4XJJ2_9BACT|nr:MAG: polyribonucleotide nucleotidyltransferase [Candidatus Abawacabacteria bacterium RBG_16_42_10]
MSVYSSSAEIAGRNLTIETGELALQVQGSVVVRYADVVVLATAAVAEPRPGIDFFPLLIDYEEKFYASGKIRGSRYMKREGRPSDNAILADRLIDRPIRPLFPKGFINDVQVICTVLSADSENDPAIVALIGASAALSLAGLPFEGPVGAVRIGLIDGKLIVNPTYTELDKSKLNLVVAGTMDAIMMVECEAHEIDEETMSKALEFAHQEVKKTVAVQNDLIKKKGVTKVEYPLVIASDMVGATSGKKLLDVVKEFIDEKEMDTVFSKPLRKEIDAAMDEMKTTIKEKVLAVDDSFVPAHIVEVVDQFLKKHLRKNILEKDKRPDGRKLNEVRPLSSKVGFLPRTHGSAVFNRGETQALTIVTIGSKAAGQMFDEMDLDYTKHYMHHYNFPPYSSGEVRPLRGGPGRREIGHGYLAEKALVPVLPPLDTFPYAIRVVTEIMGSNGSTSMASVCGSTLSLMDAGVPIKAPVAGVAMGLMSDGKGTFKVLTDIRDLEDFGGDMDFKVAGTKDGITALQMDIKLQGITIDIMKEALMQAKEGRLFILDKILETIAAPRPEMSRYAPRVVSIKVDPEQVREVIGSGGKTINGIIEATGVEINIEDDGTVLISSNNEEGIADAIKIIKGITYKFIIGDVFEGTVVKVVQDRMSGKEIGVIVEKAPGKDGMVHISELAPRRIEKISEVCRVGDKLKVVVIDIDPVKHRVALSHKEYLNRFAGKDEK